MSWFKRKPKEYVYMSLDEAKAAHGVGGWRPPASHHEPPIGGEYCADALCTPSRGDCLTGYTPEDDYSRHALQVPAIDTTIRSEPSHAYPRRWQGEETAIEVTKEFERIAK